MKFEGQVQNIELRGIERDKEDNLCNIGAMNEVIGMEYKDGSYIPYMPVRNEHPYIKDIKYIRIHKTSYGDNILVIWNDNRLHWFTKHNWDNHIGNGTYLCSGAMSIEFVGNMACIQVQDNLKFALFKDENYSVVSQVSEWDLPTIEFRKQPEYENEDGKKGEEYISSESVDYLNEDGNLESETYFDSNDFRTLVLGSMNKALGKPRNEGYLEGSTMITYAIRLSNGNLIRAQIPTVIPSMNTIDGGFMSVNIVPRDSKNLQRGKIKTNVACYKIQRKIKYNEMPEEIKQYVSSICIFLSPEVTEYGNFSTELDLIIETTKSESGFTDRDFNRSSRTRSANYYPIFKEPSRPQKSKYYYGQVDMGFFNYMRSELNADLESASLKNLVNAYNQKYDSAFSLPSGLTDNNKTNLVYGNHLKNYNSANAFRANKSVSCIGWLTASEIASYESKNVEDVVTESVGAVFVNLSRKEDKDIVDQLRRNPFLYKVEEIPINDLEDYKTGEWETIDLEGCLGDNLVVREVLPASAFKNEKINGELFTYNGRLHVYNITDTEKYDENIWTKVINAGQESYNGKYKINCKADCYVAVEFNDGHLIVKSRRNYLCSHGYMKKTGEISGDIILPILVGYPSSDVKSIHIYKRAYERYHPSQRQGYYNGSRWVKNIKWANYIWEAEIPVSCYSNGYSVTIKNLREGLVIKGKMEITQDKPLEFILPKEVKNKNNNLIKISDANYPLYFPISHRIGDGKLLGFARTSIALSQDTFGKFPLLAFCTDGIYAMNVDLSGDTAYSVIAPFSREVCVNKNSICEIDGMILFATDKGLCVATQYNIQEFIKHLNGKIHNTPTEGTENGNGLKLYHNAIDNDSLVRLTDSISLEDFTDFVTDKYTCVRYVSNKNAIIVYNKNTNYCYFINIPTQYATKLPLQIYRRNNDFPDEQFYQEDIIDFANDTQDNLSIPCLVQSRPIKIIQDFKSIYKVALRGYFKNDTFAKTKGTLNVKFRDDSTFVDNLQNPPVGKEFSNTFIFDGYLNENEFKQAYKDSNLLFASEAAYKLTLYDNVSMQKGHIYEEVSEWGISDIKNIGIKTKANMIIKVPYDFTVKYYDIDTDNYTTDLVYTGNKIRVRYRDDEVVLYEFQTDPQYGVFTYFSESLIPSVGDKMYEKSNVYEHHRFYNKIIGKLESTQKRYWISEIIRGKENKFSYATISYNSGEKNATDIIVEEYFYYSRNVFNDIYDEDGTIVSLYELRSLYTNEPFYVFQSKELLSENDTVLTSDMIKSGYRSYTEITNSHSQSIENPKVTSTRYNDFSGQEYKKEVVFDGHLNEDDIKDMYAIQKIKTGETEEGESIYTDLYDYTRITVLYKELTFANAVFNSDLSLRDDVDKFTIVETKQFTIDSIIYTHATLLIVFNDGSSYTLGVKYTGTLNTNQIKQALYNDNRVIKTINKSIYLSDFVEVNGENNYTLDITIAKDILNSDLTYKEYVNHVIVVIDDTHSVDDKVYTYGTVTIRFNGKDYILSRKYEGNLDTTSFAQALYNENPIIGTHQRLNSHVPWTHKIKCKWTFEDIQHEGYTEGTFHVTFKTAEELSVTKVKPYYGKTFNTPIILNKYIPNEDEFKYELYKTYNKNNTFVIYDHPQLEIKASDIFNDNGSLKPQVEYLTYTMIEQGALTDKYAGLYILGSLDGKNWHIIGAKEKSLAAPFHDFGVESYRVGIKYMMIIFVGELSSGSHIDGIQLTANNKYNNKLK